MQSLPFWSKNKPRKRPTFKPKEPLFGKKRKFRQEKSFSFGDFHDGTKMLSEQWKASESDEPAVEMILQDMKAEIFAATLRKLEDSVDEEFFERFFQEMMAKTHKTVPKLKTLSMKFIVSIENIEILHRKLHSVHCKFIEILLFFV